MGSSEKKKRRSVLVTEIDPDILSILLKDRTTNTNIIWATDDYSLLGEGYDFKSPIQLELITGDNYSVIKPRVEKDRDAETQRSKDKAEVFTPSWVCNVQNNLIDDAWFQQKRKRFNTEKYESWETNYYKVFFPPKLGKTWQDYVKANRLEVSCGEAPYLTSRYDTVTGNLIPARMRIGLLDRKLRIISENVDQWQTWLKWAKIALQSTYGFEWQGDNVLLARENLLLTTAEHYQAKFGRTLGKATLQQFEEIISWNIWQMDGIKFVVPETCHEVEDHQMTLFGIESKREPCPGCRSGDRLRHNGIYATIMDWEENKVIRFVDTLEGGKQNGTV